MGCGKPPRLAQYCQELATKRWYNLKTCLSIFTNPYTLGIVVNCFYFIKAIKFLSFYRLIAFSLFNWYNIIV